MSKAGSRVYYLFLVLIIGIGCAGENEEPAPQGEIEKIDQVDNDGSEAMRNSKIDPDAWEVVDRDGVVRVAVDYVTGYTPSNSANSAARRRQEKRNSQARTSGRRRISGPGAEHVRDSDSKPRAIWILNKKKLEQLANDPEIKGVWTEKIENSTIPLQLGTPQKLD